MKKCRYCNKPIEFKEVSDRWVPMNADGTFHDCKKRWSRSEAWKRAHHDALETSCRMDSEFRVVVK